MTHDRDATQSFRSPMLRRFTDLKNYAIGAVDGDVGSIHDLFFDDEDWTVRHLVVDTGRWLSGRKVLISPMAIVGIDPSGLRVLTRLTTVQVREAPDIDTDAPVSRQHEMRLAAHYGLPEYWAGPFRWGASPFPYVHGDLAAVGLEIPVAEPRAAAVREEMAARVTQEGDPHLHSARAVAGLGLHATDGDLGHVEDFLIDEAAWVIRYLIADPRNWWPDNHVPLSTDWVTGVNWDDRRVEVDVSRDAVRHAPPTIPPCGSSATGSAGSTAPTAAAATGRSRRTPPAAAPPRRGAVGLRTSEA
jgi:hypothetical protein